MTSDQIFNRYFNLLAEALQDPEPESTPKNGIFYRAAIRLAQEIARRTELEERTRGELREPAPTQPFVNPRERAPILLLSRERAIEIAEGQRLSTTTGIVSEWLIRSMQYAYVLAQKDVLQ